MATPFKPARISGQIPAGYTGPIFYRTSGFQRKAASFKTLSDYLKFPGRDVRGVNRIVALSGRDAIIDTSDFTSYLDSQGNVDSEWSTPIRAVTKSNYREDWPEFSYSNIPLVSERLKKAIDTFGSNNHAFVAMDVEAPSGEHLFRAYVMVTGVAIDAVDYLASGITPNKVYPGGKALWYPDSALPRDEFCYLSREKIRGRHHFWDEKLGNVFSEEIVKELGDVLPKEFVFVPMGVVD